MDKRSLNSSLTKTGRRGIDVFLDELSVLIVSHIAFGTGHSQELENFLKRRVQKLVFIGHPFFYVEAKNSFVTIYEKGRFKSKIEAPKIMGPEFLFYLKDFVLTFYFILRLKSRFDIYVGADPLNALVGILLRQLSIVRVAIFYVIDYVPVRFKNPIFNGIYHFIDRICVYHANYTWNLTSAMMDARAKRGIKNKKTNQIVVPTGTPFDRVKHLPIEEINKTNMVFISHLRKGQGIELILEAMPMVVEKIPSVKLIVIGTGQLEKKIKREVKEKKIDNNVLFLGYIENHEEAEKIISKCGVGIAPYVPDSGSFTWYADPGKPKVYLGCGVPVIITKVPEVAFEIEKRGAGIVIDYNKHELIDAIVKLLTNYEMYCQCRRKALEFASEYTWDNIFFKAFNQILTTESAV